MRALRKAILSDSGSVLIAVIGIMIVVTVIAIGAFAMADDNLFQSKRDRAGAQALHVAEAGLDIAAWDLDSNVVTAFPFTFETATPSGVSSTTISKVGNFTYLIVSRGTSITTPTVTRTISTQMFVMSLWDMFFADGPVNPGANGHINGNGSIHGSMYCRGDWPTTNGNAVFTDGPFFVNF